MASRVWACYGDLNRHHFQELVIYAAYPSCGDVGLILVVVGFKDFLCCIIDFIIICSHKAMPLFSNNSSQGRMTPISYYTMPSLPSGRFHCRFWACLKNCTFFFFYHFITYSFNPFVNNVHTSILAQPLYELSTRPVINAHGSWF